MNLPTRVIFCVAHVLQTKKYGYISTVPKSVLRILIDTRATAKIQKDGTAAPAASKSSDGESDEEEEDGDDARGVADEQPDTADMVGPEKQTKWQASDKWCQRPTNSREWVCQLGVATWV